MPPEVGIGSVLAGFRLESLIGAGAVGTVYRAEDTKQRSSVALKLLTRELADDDRFRKRFLRETELAASLDHPHIVPTVASGEEDGTLYLAMAYVDGFDLRELLDSQGRLEPERALGLVSQVAAALDAAHAAGLVHRDVKPRNILVATPAGGEHAYLCDFGLARHVSSVSSLTGDRGFVGTIDYVPPEQIEGSAIDGRADVYSLGCVLYECLAGARPFAGESELSVVFAHLNEPPPRLSVVRPELPEAFDAVFATALAKSPGDRYATCGELVEAARDASRGKVFGRRKLRRRRLLMGAAAVVAAAGAAVGGVLATRGDSHRGQLASSQATPAITQTAIAGVKLGQEPGYYKDLLGGWRAQELSEVHYPSLAFQQPQVAVYFPAKRKPAHIITTWNRNNETAEGIGPCSTLAKMRKAYGDRITATWAGTSPDGKIHRSWAVGKNLLFVTQDRSTIADVVLYKGLRIEKHGGSPQDYANYVGAVETACK
jgi:serine/threonine-protein kinase